jgi:hypothetical protein
MFVIGVQRRSSATFEATPVFASAKMGGGSNVRCNDLLGTQRTEPYRLEFIEVPPAMLN